MPLTLEEILALPDIGQKINYLKKGRKTELPDRCKLWDDWNPEHHEIIVDKEKYPDRKVLEKEAEKVFDEKTGKTYEIEAKYKTEFFYKQWKDTKEKKEWTMIGKRFIPRQ